MIMKSVATTTKSAVEPSCTSSVVLEPNQRGERDVDQQRHQQEEADREHQPEREEARVQERAQACAAFLRRAPDGVEAVLQFGERGGRADQEP